MKALKEVSLSELSMTLRSISANEVCLNDFSSNYLNEPIVWNYSSSSESKNSSFLASSYSSSLFSSIRSNSVFSKTSRLWKLIVQRELIWSFLVSSISLRDLKSSYFSSDVLQISDYSLEDYRLYRIGFELIHSKSGFEGVWLKVTPEVNSFKKLAFWSNSSFLVFTEALSFESATLSLNFDWGDLTKGGRSDL